MDQNLQKICSTKLQKLTVKIHNQICRKIFYCHFYLLTFLGKYRKILNLLLNLQKIVWQNFPQKTHCKYYSEICTIIQSQNFSQISQKFEAIFTKKCTAIFAIKILPANSIPKFVCLNVQKILQGKCSESFQQNFQQHFLQIIKIYKKMNWGNFSAN